MELTKEQIEEFREITRRSGTGTERKHIIYSLCDMALKSIPPGVHDVDKFYKPAGDSTSGQSDADRSDTLTRAAHDALRYRAIRAAGSQLKLWIGEDWCYKPRPDMVDEWCDEAIAKTSVQQPTNEEAK